jgi:hypothetical protein
VTHGLVEAVAPPQGARPRGVGSLGTRTPAPAADGLALAHTREGARTGQHPGGRDARGEALGAPGPAARCRARPTGWHPALVAGHPAQGTTEAQREAGPGHVGPQRWQRRGLDAVRAPAGLSARPRGLPELRTRTRLGGPRSEHATPDGVRRTAVADLVGASCATRGDEAVSPPLDRLPPQRVAREREGAARERTLFHRDARLGRSDPTATACEGPALQHPQAPRGDSRDSRPDGKHGGGWGGSGTASRRRTRGAPGLAPLGPPSRRGGRRWSSGGDAPRARPWGGTGGGPSPTRCRRSKLAAPTPWWRAGPGTGPPPRCRRGGGRLAGERPGALAAEPGPAEASQGGPRSPAWARATGGAAKDRAIRATHEQRVRGDLRKLQARVAPGTLKAAAQVPQAIGRLTERDARVARYAAIGSAAPTAAVTWAEDAEQTARAPRLDGGSLRKTDRQDLPDEDVWRTDLRLTRGEAAFRARQSPRDERPIFPPLAPQVQTPLVLWGLAEHRLGAIEKRCLDAGLHPAGAPRRAELATPQGVPVVVPASTGVVRTIRKGSPPAPRHTAISATLDIPAEVRKPVKTWVRAIGTEGHRPRTNSPDPSQQRVEVGLSAWCRRAS